MALGPGKYDELVTLVRERTSATGVVLIVIGGNKGEGFCVQGEAQLTVRLPAFLRTIADSIENDLKRDLH